MRVIRQKSVIAALVLAAIFAAPIQAQNVAQVGGPAEQPPASFTGQQYVDSRGCVFMRAGFSGRTNWVPRIGRDRRPICNAVTPAQAAARLAQGDVLAPTLEVPPLASAVGAAAVGTAPRQPANVGAPMATVASNLGTGQRTGVFAPISVPGLDRQAARQPVPAPSRTAPPVAANPVAANTLPSSACPSKAPVLEYLPLSTGGQVAVCTRGDGTATGWVSPAARTVGGAISDAHHGAYGQGLQQAPRMAMAGLNQGGTRQGVTGGYVQTVIAGQSILAPVQQARAYEPAWEDDRLNPLRGLGTQQGWADQAQVWNNKLPAQTFDEVARQKARKQPLVGQNAARVTTATMSAGAQVHASTGGRLYVQVGTFGQEVNAHNAAGRLAGMGLPVSKSTALRKGQQLVAIMAGPFTSAAQAQQALHMARRAGFEDAYIR